MPLALVGELSLWVALLFAAWGLLTSAAAGPLARADLALSGTRSIHASAVMLALAGLALATSFVRRDFGTAYVAAFGGQAATPGEMIAALWASPPGALLSLALVLSAVGSAYASHRSPAASAATQLVLFGVLATLLGSESPFERLPFPAGDGRGLPPQLREGAAFLVWPMWAGAMAASTAAFAMAIQAAGASGDVQTGPEASARRANGWVLAAWGLHSTALLLALWWSYGIASSQQSWLTRAVGPASLAAWVALGLAAHLPAIERRRLLGVRARTAGLALTLPMILASGVLAAEGSWQPLHELVHGPGGAWWIVLIAAVLQVGAYTIARARRDAGVEATRAEGGVAGGRDEPDLRTRGTRNSVGTRLSHVGVVIALIGVAGGAAKRERTVTLEPGSVVVVSDLFGREWEITYQGLSVREERTTLGAARWRELLLPVALAPAGADGGDASDARQLLVPEIREHVDLFGRPTSPPWPRTAVRHAVLQDVVVEPDSIGDGEEVRLRVAFVPLAGLIWLGGSALVAGVALALVGSRH